MKVSLIEALVALSPLYALAAAIWFGLWRSWASHPEVRGRGHFPFLIPWFAVAITIEMLISSLPVDIRAVVPMQVRGALFFGLFGFGFFTVLADYPRWAFPRWFREQELGERPLKDRETDS